MYQTKAERDGSTDPCQIVWRRIGFGRDACESASCREGEKRHDERTNTFVMEGNEKAHELATEGAGVD